jgi:hypothetical protein
MSLSSAPRRMRNMAGKTLGILIGVSEYRNLDPLPGCKNDLAAMRDFLIHSAKVEEHNLLVIDHNTNSSDVKGTLSGFVQKHSGSTPDEIFFYFTGHGMLTDDFYFVLSDYVASQEHATTLANNEVDVMFKSLSPKLMVKVVDACQSGISYVKNVDGGSDDLKSVVEKSKAGFNNCYFLFSSQERQKSYQPSQYSLSLFTHAFITSLASHPATSIRYKDIISHITDWFENAGKRYPQTPFFVTQATFTEACCDISSDLRSALLKHATTTMQATPGQFSVTGQPAAMTHSPTEPQPPKSIADQIVEQVKHEQPLYCGRDQMISAFNAIQQVVNAHLNQNPILDLFEIETVFNSTSTIPSKRQSVNWFKANPNDYFVDFEYGSEPYEEVEKVENTVPGFKGIGLGTYSFVRTQKTRRVPIGVYQSDPAAFQSVQIHFKPKHENLHHWEGFLAMFFSKMELRLFYTLNRLRDLSWTTQDYDGPVKWTTTPVALSNIPQIERLIDQQLKRFDDTIIKYLVERYCISPESDGAGDQLSDTQGTSSEQQR